LHFWGLGVDRVLVGVCANKPRSISNACKNLRRLVYKDRNVVSRKMFTSVGQYAPVELFWLWTKVHQISFLQRRRGCGWSSFFKCSICRSTLEIFAIEVEKSCQKWRRNLDVFGPPKFWGQAFQKFYPHYHPCLAAHDLDSLAAKL